MISTDLLNVDEAAAFLNTGPNVVRGLLRARALVGFKVAGQWRIPRSALAEFVIQQLEKGGRRGKTLQA